MRKKKYNNNSKIIKVDYAIGMNEAHNNQQTQSTEKQTSLCETTQDDNIIESVSHGSKSKIGEVLERNELLEEPQKNVEKEEVTKDNPLGAQKNNGNIPIESIKENKIDSCENDELITVERKKFDGVNICEPTEKEMYNRNMGLNKEEEEREEETKNVLENLEKIDDESNNKPTTVEKEIVEEEEGEVEGENHVNNKNTLEIKKYGNDGREGFWKKTIDFSNAKKCDNSTNKMILKTSEVIEENIFHVLKNMSNKLANDFPECDIKEILMKSQNRLKEEYETNRRKVIENSMFDRAKHKNIYNLIKEKIQYGYKRNNLRTVNHEIDMQEQFNYCVKNMKRNKSIFFNFDYSRYPSTEIHAKLKLDQTNGNIIIGDRDGYIKIFNFYTGNIIISIKAHKFPIADFDIHKSNKYLVSCDTQGNVKMWLIDKYQFKLIYSHKKKKAMKRVLFYYNESKNGTEPYYKTFVLCLTYVDFFILKFDNTNNDSQILQTAKCNLNNEMNFFPYLKISYCIRYSISPRVCYDMIMSKKPIPLLKNSYLFIANINEEHSPYISINPIEWISGLQIMNDNKARLCNCSEKNKKLANMSFLLLTSKSVQLDSENRTVITPNNVKIAKYINSVHTHFLETPDEDVIEVMHKSVRKRKVNECDHRYQMSFQKLYDYNLLEDIQSNPAFSLFKKFEEFPEEISIFEFANLSCNFLTIHKSGSFYLWYFQHYLEKINRNAEKKKINNWSLNLKIEESGTEKIEIISFHTSLYREYVMETYLNNASTKWKNKGNAVIVVSSKRMNSLQQNAHTVVDTNNNNNNSNNNNHNHNNNNNNHNNNSDNSNSNSNNNNHIYNNSDLQELVSCENPIDKTHDVIIELSEDDNVYVISSTSSSSYCYSSDENQNKTKEEKEENKKKKKNASKGAYKPPALQIKNEIHAVDCDCCFCFYNKRQNNKNSVLRGKKLFYKITNVSFNISDEYIVVADGITNKSNSVKKDMTAVTLKTCISIFCAFTHRELKSIELKGCDSYVKFIIPNPVFSDIILVVCFRKNMYLVNVRQQKIVKKFSYDKNLVYISAKWNNNGTAFVVMNNSTLFSIFSINSNKSYACTIPEQITNHQHYMNLLRLHNEQEAESDEEEGEGEDILTAHTRPDVVVIESTSNNNNSSNNNNTNEVTNRNRTRNLNYVEHNNNSNNNSNSNNTSVSPIQIITEVTNSGNTRNALNRTTNSENIERENKRGEKKNQRNENTETDIVHISSSDESPFKKRNKIQSVIDIDRVYGYKGNEKEKDKVIQIYDTENDDVRSKSKNHSSKDFQKMENQEIISIDMDNKDCIVQSNVKKDESTYKTNDVHVQKESSLNNQKIEDLTGATWKEFSNTTKSNNDICNNMRLKRKNEEMTKHEEGDGTGSSKDHQTNIKKKRVKISEYKKQYQQHIPAYLRKVLLDTSIESNTKQGNEDYFLTDSILDNSSDWDSDSSASLLLRRPKFRNKKLLKLQSEWDSSSNSDISSSSSSDSILEENGNFEKNINENLFMNINSNDPSKFCDMPIFNFNEEQKKEMHQEQRRNVSHDILEEKNKMEKKKIKQKRMEKNYLHVMNNEIYYKLLKEEKKYASSNYFANKNTLVNTNLREIAHLIQPMLPAFSNFNSNGGHVEAIKNHKPDGFPIYFSYLAHLHKKIKKCTDVEILCKELSLYDLAYKIVKNHPTFTSIHMKCSRRKEENELKQMELKSSIFLDKPGCLLNSSNNNNNDVVESVKKKELFVKVGVNNNYGYTNGNNNFILFEQEIDDLIEKLKNNLIENNSYKNQMKYKNMLRIKKIFNKFREFDSLRIFKYKKHMKESGEYDESMMYRILKKFPCAEEENIDSFIYYHQKSVHVRNVKDLMKCYLTHYEKIDKDKNFYGNRLFVYNNANQMLCLNPRLMEELRNLESKYTMNFLQRKNYSYMLNYSLKGRECRMWNHLSDYAHDIYLSMYNEFAFSDRVTERWDINNVSTLRGRVPLVPVHNTTTVSFSNDGSSISLARGGGEGGGEAQGSRPFRIVRLPVLNISTGLTVNEEFRLFHENIRDNRSPWTTIHMPNNQLLNAPQGNSSHPSRFINERYLSFNVPEDFSSYTSDPSATFSLHATEEEDYDDSDEDYYTTEDEEVVVNELDGEEEEDNDDSDSSYDAFGRSQRRNRNRRSGRRGTRRRTQNRNGSRSRNQTSMRRNNSERTRRSRRVSRNTSRNNNRNRRGRSTRSNNRRNTSTREVSRNNTSNAYSINRANNENVRKSDRLRNREINRQNEEHANATMRRSYNTRYSTRNMNERNILNNNINNNNNNNIYENNNNNNSNHNNIYENNIINITDRQYSNRSNNSSRNPYNTRSATINTNQNKVSTEKENQPIEIKDDDSRVQTNERGTKRTYECLEKSSTIECHKKKSISKKRNELSTATCNFRNSEKIEDPEKEEEKTKRLTNNTVRYFSRNGESPIRKNSKEDAKNSGEKKKTTRRK